MVEAKREGVSRGLIDLRCGAFGRFLGGGCPSGSRDRIGKPLNRVFSLPLAIERSPKSDYLQFASSDFSLQKSGEKIKRKKNPPAPAGGLRKFWFPYQSFS